jgi:spermidine/putrescine transport system ATP-binding protein
MNDYAVEMMGVSKVFGGLRGVGADVQAVHHMDLAIRQGEFFTLLGPSGCGKTTTLRMIAGFESPTEGEIHIQGREMSHIPPNRRPVNTVFQNYALFPHLTVAENVEFGLAVKHVSRPERQARVKEAIRLVQLEGLDDRKPGQLSGGQQQRVALARALVNEPGVLLLDEPLGALDLKLRKAMQLELKHLQTKVGITFIYVTHDQEEALTMSDRIAVMDGGHVLQVGHPIDIYEDPSTRFVADFVGETNFLEGHVEAVQNGHVEVGIAGALVQARTPRRKLAKGGEVTLIVRPEKLALARANGHQPGGMPGRIQEVVYIGTDTRYVVELSSGAKLVVRVQNDGTHHLGGYKLGDQVFVDWEPEDARVLVEARAKRPRPAAASGAGPQA